MTAYLWTMLVVTVIAILSSLRLALNGETMTTPPNVAAAAAAINCGFLVWIGFLLAGSQ